MGRIVYLMNASLDGYVEGRDGTFGWSRPDEEVHRFHNAQASAFDAFLYGRRMYELMRSWEQVDADPSLPDYVREFASIWTAKPKIVFSTTQKSVGENARLAGGDVSAEVSRLKQELSGDLAVSGPGLASSFARLELIDEYRLVLSPVLVGGGKSYFPPVEQEVPLRLVETRTFNSGAVYLRYERAPSPGGTRTQA